jgi:hypothetical protein
MVPQGGNTMAESSEAKAQPIPSRQLVLHVMLSLLVSVAVFVVVSWMVLVPQLARHEKRIRELEAAVSDMQDALSEAEEPPPAAAAPSAATPAAPGTPAPAAPAAEKK